MPSLTIKILGFLGMRQDVPPAVLDVESAQTKALAMYELVRIDPSELPLLVPDQAMQWLNPTASTHFPRIQN